QGSDSMQTLDRELHPRAALVRRLGSSTFNYWFGYVANCSLIVYLLAQARGSQQPSAPAYLAYALLGLVLWTLAEYALHRYLYHELASPLQVGHLLHHDEPRALIGVPWYLTTVALLGTFHGLALVARPGPL